ncbi:hypothetical protein K438DRAFT_77617 [Mycena galopus ATCC 62051]|nr:hypothetical protein K438DRAFT_77617 [Mycena galopus ATCC 62051]
MDVGRIGRSPESRWLFLLPTVITSVFSYASEGFVLCVARAKGTYRNRPEKATNLEEVGEGLVRVVEVGLRGRQTLPTSPCQMVPNRGTSVSADSVSVDHRPRQWAANHGRPGLPGP